MLGHKRLLLGIEFTLFGLLLLAVAIGGGAQQMPGLVGIGLVVGSLGLVIAIWGSLTAPDA